VPHDPPTGSHLGTAADPFVIEGDEYDSAFFDKRSKFIHYAPHIAVLNNLEFDHADIFRDLADVQRTFSHLTRIVPRNGFIVMNGDDENLRALGPLPWTRVVSVGTGRENDLQIVDFAETATGASFRLVWRCMPWGEVRWSQPGLFNARNAAMAACAAGLALAIKKPRAEKVERAVPERSERVGDDALHLPNLPDLLKLDALARFRGVKRRQEILAATPRLTIIEDFGHHPTALAETLRSFRARFPGATLTAVFEPRSNTARTKALQAGFALALALADEVYLGAVNRAEKLAADERFDTDTVVRQLGTQKVRAYAFADNQVLLAKLSSDALAASEHSRVVVFFTNGSFDGIIPKFTTAAKKPR
jgi:UDP-N-acetylmuramate: L-alanyl-gamma-D-glutamyl-meso-diaminopimelate ligase